MRSRLGYKDRSRKFSVRMRILYLNAAERRNALPMFYLELVSGLRKGELVALQWSDLDEANCTISVSKQASWDTEGNLILSRPKTGNSIREVSIPQDAVELLKQEHAKHPSNPWMFSSGRTGEMYHPDSVVTLHKRILKDAGLEHIRFHDLRHTFATLALQNGMDVKTVSSMLGHYDAGFTLRTYTHATRQMTGREKNWSSPSRRLTPIPSTAPNCAILWAPVARRRSPASTPAVYSAISPTV